MASSGDQKNVNETSADERWTLEKKKLELEIKHLASPWPRTLSILAPVATILVALLGFAWAATTGFFDVSRRELDTRKREVELDTRVLIERRDEQTRRFVAEAAHQRAEIDRLRREYASLLGANLKLDTEAKRLVHDRNEQVVRFLAETSKQRRLTKRRDEEERRFRAEAASRTSQINDLQDEVAVLRRRLLELAQPVLTAAEFQAGGDAIAVNRPAILLRGVNFGVVSGEIGCNLETPVNCVPKDDGKSMYCTSDIVITGNLCKVEKWSTDSVVVRFNIPYLSRTLTSRQELSVLVIRSDGKKSNSRRIAIPDKWARVP